ncbi:acyl carrier protein ['Paenibacillus yunnanensis' Narsing Rao et al. 2020]|uniref:acyl carrier protein n=1 Tax=Paenibacillus tengchongensis TaxID=2608684 RepID=UPI00124C9A6A|nr:acyl carrier protein [Paenibacillus tengchongensis]
MKLKEIVAGVLKLPAGDIDGQASPQNVPGWTSLKQVELITTIEEAYQVKFTMKEMKSLKSYAAFENVLRGKGIGDEAF